MCGLTLNNCGLTGEPVSTIEQQLKEEVHLWFGIPSVVNYGVVLGHSWNVTLSDFHVTNTRGLGLLGINVLGNSILDQVRFTFNTMQSCINSPPRFPFNVSNVTILRQIGGGAYFLYQDELTITQENPVYTLEVRNSTFSHNAECSYAAISQVNVADFTRYTRDVYQVGAGGGLTVFVSQENFNIHTTVKDTVFSQNKGRYGAGAHVGIFAGVPTCNITFDGCTFEQNGILSRDVTKYLSVGGSGLALFTDLLPPEQSSNFVERNDSITAVVTIVATRFLSNVAGVEGGGLLVYSLFTTTNILYEAGSPEYFSIHINIRDCIFKNNSAQYGIAAFFQQNVHVGIAGSVLLTSSNVTYSNNRLVVNSDHNAFRFLQDTSGQSITSAVALLNIFASNIGNVVVSDNEATGILLQSTPMLIYEGALIVERNSGHRGGGIHIAGEGSGLVFNAGTMLHFINNSASIYGGAIYVSSSVDSNDILRPTDTATGCFLSPFPSQECFEEGCFDDAFNGVEIRFAGNFAPIGSVVYGSTLKACTWTIELSRIAPSTSSIYQILYNNISEVDFDVNPISSSEVSTPPASLRIEGDNGVMSGGETILRVYPGQGTNLSITVFDQFEYVVPATITAHVFDSDMDLIDCTLGTSGFFFTGDGDSTVLRVTGPEEQQFSVFFIELETLVSTNITVRTLPCLHGFMLVDQICICNNELAKNEIKCDLDKIQLISPDMIWVGNLTANASTEELVISTCYLEYCKEGAKPFRPPHYEDQCTPGLQRTGVLCGRCKSNYSVVLGSRECRRCTNYYLLLIPLFGFLGIVLFLMIAFLEVTVEKGWMYSILFYCNVVTLSSLSLSLPSGWESVYVPAHLLSFELGIGICFYNGMETIHRVFLKLLFPLYLFILMFAFSLLARKCTFSRRFSPAKTFVTLGVMSYTSILDTCVEIVAATNLKTVDGRRHLRWLADPNVIYFRGAHCALVIVAAVIFVIYLIPVPLILLSPQIAYKFKKLSPFFDAMWAPFKPKYRWWLGARLLICAVLFFSTNSHPTVGKVSVGLFLLIMIEVHSIIQPFKKTRVNIMDSTLIGSIIALALGVLFFTEKNEAFAIAYIVITILSGYALIIGVLVHHFSSIWRLKDKMGKVYTHFKEIKKEDVPTVIALSILADENVPPPPPPPAHPPLTSYTSFNMNESMLPQRADFSHFRESLLESQ
jgi:predicted outer membrane repeat protein